MSEETKEDPIEKARETLTADQKRRAEECRKEIAVLLERHRCQLRGLPYVVQAGPGFVLDAHVTCEALP